MTVNQEHAVVRMRLIDFKREWLHRRIEVPAPQDDGHALRGTVVKIGSKYTTIRRTDRRADVTVLTPWLMEQVAFNRVKRLPKRA